MKYVTIFLVILICSCSSFQYINPSIQIETEEIKSHLKQITGTPEPRNYQNISSLNMVANYIDSIFREHSDEVYLETFNVDNFEYKNIICSFGPSVAPRIVIGAHYDVCYDQPGADDNASGVTGLLVLAKLLKEYSPENKRVDLVAFSLEEPPFFRTEHMGSAIYAKNLKETNVDVELMICLEMIGYFDDRPESQKFPIGFLNWFYPDTGNFIAVVSNFRSHSIGSDIKKKMRSVSNIGVYQLTGPSFITGIDFSDHQNFWKNGIKAVMITDTAFFRNPNYHKRTDTIDTLDLKKMSEVIKGIYFAIINI